MAHIAGLVAAGELPSPLPHADVVTCTTYKTLLGPHGGLILSTSEHAKAVDRAIFPGTQGAPAMSQIAAKAVCLELAAREPFREAQRRTMRLAASLARELAALGDRIVTGGTDTHMVLVDLRARGLTGDLAEAALERIGILTNRNLIPFDPETPARTSGLRIGTPGAAVRRMDGSEAPELAALIDAALRPGADDAALRPRLEVLLEQFPLPDH